jgi:hypothetical protein
LSGGARRRAAAASAPLTLGILFATTSCGIPTAASPQVLGGMPVALIQPATKFQKPKETPVHHQFDVYFVANDVHVLIGLPRAGPPTPALALRDLEAGPTSLELSDGITSAVPADVGATIVGIDKKKTAVVNLDLGALSPLGLAQIVWTVTVPPVKSVLFLEAGQLVHVPIGSGQTSVDRAVTRADYENYAPA